LFIFAYIDCLYTIALQIKLFVVSLQLI